MLTMDESVYNLDFNADDDYGDISIDLQDFNDIIEEDGSLSPEMRDRFLKQESEQDLSGGDEHYGSLQLGHNYRISCEGGEKFSHTSMPDTCANNVSGSTNRETPIYGENICDESYRKSFFVGDSVANAFCRPDGSAQATNVCRGGINMPSCHLSSTESSDLNGFNSHCERQASSTENSDVFGGEIIEEALSPTLVCSQSSMVLEERYDKLDEIDNKFVPFKKSPVDNVSRSFCDRRPTSRFLPMALNKHLIDMKTDKETTSDFSSKIIHSEKQSSKDECVSVIDKNLKELDSMQLHTCNEDVLIMSNRPNRIRDDRKCKFDQMDGVDSCPGKSFSGTSTYSSSVAKKYGCGDDGDLHIIENLSQPMYPTISRRPNITSQGDIIKDSFPHTSIGSIRVKENERFLLQVALQDLSQPKSEINLPDGILTVPLLRHQRIALSWMVQKETTSLYCSGGILADDQGLGKTMSTIALIMAERSPSSKVCSDNSRQRKTETLNLDEDDEKIIDVDGPAGDMESYQANYNTIPDIVHEESRSSFVQRQGRPAGGTLVVCPTSVLRQWYEELIDRVSNEANLSVLVYHGSNRTKDPFDLAKYDVVLTTYSIVSMEVPKQPLVDKDDDEKGTAEDVIPQNYSNKKRKYINSVKGKKGIDSLTLESLARPLARVGWFRVVLDEAQSIKNHRTQVARACWGLRAKRRWCLSGTPIQNTIDDLYSYFRFLRYDPYAVYKSFCSTIKLPISRNPTSGYRKLQAVLRTIMLRRTKGTLLDGEPIIYLPPKSIELRKVDFSKEERDFYTKLENDSRAQFQVYAAAGTVKQNYVNILLMLLRLRQACDHPLLVRGNNSNLIQESLLESARKLPREHRCTLLHCLEASLALCSICSDPPEDAAVTICGHVFCNQCICDHLTGDDTHCPASNCKSSLNMSSVFSKATLRSSLSDELVSNCSLDSSVPKPVETAEPWSEDSSFDSSKIKAALEVLGSLRPHDCTLKEHSSNEASASTEWSKSESEEVSTCNSRKGFLTVNKICKGNDPILGEKAIVFSQWTRMLDLLESCLRDSLIPYRRLDGTMSIAARDKAVKEFNNLPEVSVMIMSLKAASLGLNMVAACHVLMLDLWWNPATEDQAVDRAHRIGQTRPVTVVRLTVRDTVEDRILALQDKKREMVGSVFGEDKTGQQQHTRLTVEDLRYLFMA